MRTLIWDLCFFAGLALLTTAGALAYVPLGFAIPGVICLAVGLLGGWAFRRGPRGPEERR
jgi:hypothetical protein